MSLIARLGVVLGLNSSEFISGMDAATKKTREFEMNQKRALRNAQQAQDEFMALAGKGLVGVAAAALAVGKAFQYADQIEDTAKAFDTTTSSLMAMQAAFVASGGDAEMAGGALQKLAVAQQNAIEGSDELRDAFKKLGISGKDVQTLALPELFKRVAQELGKTENATERVALQTQLLGKAVKGTDWRDFTNAYKELGDPLLLHAIQENATAWGNIESAFKGIVNLAQKAVLPLAMMVNHLADIFDTMKNIREGGSTEIDWGAGELGGMPGTAITHGYGASPQRQNKAAKEIAKDAQSGDYNTRSTKDQAAAKKAADDAKRIKEAREALQLEISLIEKKAAIAEKMYAVNMKAVSLGSDAVAQEKMLLDLASDIEQIRSNAAKERSKEKAQIDLINAKETAEITARNNQYSFDNEVRRKQQERNHNLALAAIQAEGITQRDAMAAQALAEHNLLDLESKRFELGSAAYDLQKLDVDLQNKLAEARLVYLEKSKEINTEYENSAKNASDLEKFEARMFELKTNQSAQINYIYGVENKRKNNLKEQYEIEAKMFAMDLAQQKGRDIANIQSALNVERQRLELENNRYLMSTNQYSLSNLALENIHRLIEAEKKYNDQMKEAEYEMKRQGGGQKAREEYEQRIKTIEEVRDIELDAIDQINNARQRNLENEIERQKSFVDGWHYAARQFRENSENAFKRGEAAFSSVMNNMDAAISNFVETGEFKFEEFALSIIKDLIRMEMQAQATMLFRSIVGFFSPAPITTMNYDAGVGTSVGFAAAGGAINAPTIVGENGAELFVPNTPGTIIPNGSWQQAAASMGNSGFTNNGTYIANMSAIDTQSATQFLATNKNTIWAAYQSANRSVPLSR